MEELNKFIKEAPFLTNVLNPIVSHQLKIGNKRTRVSCVLWCATADYEVNFYITKLDIIRILEYKFNLIGRPVTNRLKFVAGVACDLRYIPCRYEESNSPFLSFLSINKCIKLQKRQRVYYWECVDHDLLFMHALDRDLKREKKGETPFTTPNSKYSLENLPLLK
jgi:transcription factor STE12